MTDIAFGFTIANTHLYKGCLLKQQDELPDCTAIPAPISVEFSDGTIVIAHISQQPTESDNKGELNLAIPAYQTAAKTNIPAKFWLIKQKTTTDWSAVKLLPE